MTPAERQRRWDALLAAKNAEITRLRDIAAQAHTLIMAGSRPEDLAHAAALLAGVMS